MSSFPGLYNAFRKANFPEEEAVAAVDAITNAFAEKSELAAIKKDTQELKDRMTRLEYITGGLYVLITILIAPIFIKIILG